MDTTAEEYGKIQKINAKLHLAGSFDLEATVSG